MRSTICLSVGVLVLNFATQTHADVVSAPDGIDFEVGNPGDVKIEGQNGSAGPGRTELQFFATDFLFIDEQPEFPVATFSSTGSVINSAMGIAGSLSVSGGLTVGGKTVVAGLVTGTMGHTSAIALGQGTTASESGSVALGGGSTSSGVNAFSAGTLSTALGNSSVSLGYINKAIGANSFATGHRSEAWGVESMVIGRTNFANGFASFAGGYTSVAGGTYNELNQNPDDLANNGAFAFAFGKSVQAQGKSSVALGLGTLSSGPSDFAANQYNQSSGGASASFGHDNRASGGISFATGHGTQAKGQESFTMGRGSKAHAFTSFAGGYYAEAGVANSDPNAWPGATAFAYGDNAKAVAQSSIALGSWTSLWGPEIMLRGGSRSPQAFSLSPGKRLLLLWGIKRILTPLVQSRWGLVQMHG
jgi:hypothetical protein